MMTQPLLRCSKYCSSTLHPICHEGRLRNSFFHSHLGFFCFCCRWRFFWHSKRTNCFHLRTFFGNLWGCSTQCLFTSWNYSLHFWDGTWALCDWKRPLLVKLDACSLLDSEYICRVLVHHFECLIIFKLLILQSHQFWWVWERFPFLR